MKVIGIDPGITGAVAVVSGKPGQLLTVEAVRDLPIYAEKTSTGKTRKYIDSVALRELLDEIGPVDRIMCERMVAPPGVASGVAFSMGATMGVLSAVFNLADLDYSLVSSAVWKRALEVPADKEAARQMASRVFKSDKFWDRKKDHNRAESALIAAYAINR